jgi:ADP-ribose pyrophosphatase YjhB (NUDIX family)
VAVDTGEEIVQGARAGLASGALFVDDEDRVLVVRPTYKPYWEIPGGLVEPGESPREACLREIAEELAITPELGGLIAVDWAPHPEEGDKVLFVFDGGQLSPAQLEQIRFRDGELAEYRFVPVADLDGLTVPRLVRRLTAALAARRTGRPAYLEHGTTAG